LFTECNSESQLHRGPAAMRAHTIVGVSLLL
jgi:hypothetical protein